MALATSLEELIQRFRLHPPFEHLINDSPIYDPVVSLRSELKGTSPLVASM
jgi:hypothetical protein